MKTHEYANIFPMMSRKDIEALSDDIKAKGLLDPIILLDGKILDGRNRFSACQSAGVEPEFKDYDGDDPLGFVVSHNIERRHLSTTQLAQAANKVATLRRGRQQSNAPRGAFKSQAKSQDEAAKDLGVGRRSVQRAKAIEENAIDTLKDMVDTEDVDLWNAEIVSRLPEAEQEKAVLGGVAGVKAKAKEVKQEKKEAAKQEKLDRSDAMKFATMAIAQLERINRGDAKKNDALNKVINYCEGRKTK